MLPIGNFAQQLLPDFEFRKLIDPSRLPPERFKVECLRSNPIGIVGLQCFESGGIDVTNILAFKDGPIPGPVAARAFIDEPCIELSTIGIEPDLAAASESSKSSASAACDPRLGRYFGNNGPTHLKCIAHTGLVFRSEVHQDGSARESLRTRRGNIGCGEELRQQDCLAHRNNARPVSCHHPMNAFIRRQLLLSGVRVKLD